MSSTAAPPANPPGFVQRYAHRLRAVLSACASLWDLVLLGALLLTLIWSVVLWESRRTEAERLDDFSQNLTHLTEILDETLVRQLDGIDNALLILREDYLRNKADLMRTVGLLRHGPLKGLNVSVTVIGRTGYTESSDVPDYRTPVYLGDRPHFRHFANGGADRLYRCRAAGQAHAAAVASAAVWHHADAGALARLSDQPSSRVACVTAGSFAYVCR